MSRLKTARRFLTCPRSWLQLLVLASSVVTLSCQEYPFLFQTNRRLGGRKYEVAVQTEGRTDILFVIDNSGSMAQHQQKLMSNMAGFIAVLTESVNDYHIGVISTDTIRQPAGPGCAPCCDLDTNGDGHPDWSNCDAGRLIAADGYHRWFSRPKAETQSELDSLNQALIDGFNANVTSLGTEGSAFEAPFGSMRQALDASGDIAVRYLNWGFLRPDADLAIVFLSDEDACEYPNAWYAALNRDDAECYDSTGNIAPSDYVAFLATVKGDLSRVRAAAVVGSAPDATAPLGAIPAGCTTIIDPGQLDDGLASNACGCWNVRHLPDRRPQRLGDFYCNILSDPPYGQLTTRTPKHDPDDGEGGCTTMPGSYYMSFLSELSQAHQQAGYGAGVLVDSICRADYGETLRKIATDIVISNCFDLKEQPDSAVAGNIVVYLNGAVVPQVDKGSPDPGWSYRADSNQICLEGGLIKHVGDVFEIDVVSDSLGSGG